MEVQVNLWAVLLAGLSSMVVGSIWYADSVFGAKWKKLVNLNEAKMKAGAAKAMSLAFVASLVMAYVIAHVAYLSNSFFGNSFMQDSVTTALWLWLGISAVTVVVHDLFEQRETTLTLLTIGNQLATMLAMGLIIGWLAP